MQSHIQIPRCVLAEFVNDKKSFYKYNVENGVINVGYPKRTFTSENYYSVAMEKELNRDVETPLKTLLELARKLTTMELPIQLNADILIIARTYVKSLVARSPSLFAHVCKNSVFLELLTLQNQHDIVVDYAMKNKKLSEFYDRFTMSFMINETQTPFVLPTRGLYEYALKGELCLNVPLNPRCAILFEENKTGNGTLFLQSSIVVMQSGYDDVVMKMNECAMEKQHQEKLGYVVCQDKSVLRQLSEKYAV
jgi:hypothetical protein